MCKVNNNQEKDRAKRKDRMYDEAVNGRSGLLRLFLAACFRNFRAAPIEDQKKGERGGDE